MIFTYTWGLTGSDRDQTITCGATNTSGATAADLLDLWQLATEGATDRPFHPDNLHEDYFRKRLAITLNRSGTITSAELVGTVLGTISGSGTYAQVCVNVQKVTGLTNRRYRGRMFPTGGLVARADINESGVIASTPLGILQTNFDNMYADMAGAFFIPPAVLHLKTSEAATPVSSFKVHDSCATIRHRKPRL